MKKRLLTNVLTVNYSPFYLNNLKNKTINKCVNCCLSHIIYMLKLLLTTTVNNNSNFEPKSNHYKQHFIRLLTGVICL